MLSGKDTENFLAFSSASSGCMCSGDLIICTYETHVDIIQYVSYNYCKKVAFACEYLLFQNVFHRHLATS